MNRGDFPMGFIAGNSTYVRVSRRCALAGIAAAGLSIVMNGCNHTNVRMSRESLNEIRSIEINPNVAIPDKPVVDGEVNIASNLITGLLTGSSPLPRNVGYEFGAYMDKHGIKMDQIVLRTFRRYLEEQGYFELREDGDATLDLAVLTYGFGTPAFDITKNQRNPELFMTATLRSSDSTILWKKGDFIYMGSGLTHAHSIQALWENPRLVEKSLEEASCVFAHLILSDLGPARRPPDESPKVPLPIPACDPVFTNNTTPSERRIKCIPDVGCTYE